MVKGDWDLMFGAMIRQLWRNRNCVVFDQVSEVRVSVLLCSVSLAQLMGSAFGGISAPSLRTGRMRQESVGIGSCSIQEAELWGILVGLECAWNAGSHQVIVESNSADAIRLICDGCTMSPLVMLHIAE
ncbi:hypothetical protein V6N13_132463 [Hibiscus sabdariffa]